MTLATGTRARRSWSTLLILVGVWGLVLAAPVMASHDDYGPGTVILHDRAGGGDGLVVVFEPDSEEDRIQQQVDAVAREAGLELAATDVAHNEDPDTLRVRADTPLGERTGFLARSVPPERIAAWLPLSNSGEVVMQLPRWADVADLEPASDGDYRVAGDAPVSYQLSPWILLIPLLILVGAAVVPYGALRYHGGRVVQRDEPEEDRLHRIRRAMVVAQLAIPIGLLVGLIGTGTADWAGLLLFEIAPGWQPPSAVDVLVRLAGFFAPFLVAIAASALAVLPYDRQLRGTRQSTGASARQAVRGLAVMFVPFLAYLALRPQLDGWIGLVVALAFVGGFAMFAPLLLNLALPTRALDDPPRGRLERLCTELGLRVRDIRVIDTRGSRTANAMIAGVLPQLRIVYVTDHLVEILEQDELEAVVAHEIGHGKGHHVLLKLGAGLVAITVAMGGLFAIIAVSGLSDSLGLVIAIGMPLAFILALLLAHGVLGIALEKRADDHAAETVGAEALARALDELADANKMKRRTGWLWNVLQQHPGVEQRIERLHDRSALSASVGSR